MDTIVVKFGGSSLADNNKLQTVANKIIKLYEENDNVVVVVSAQGKMTDRLIKEAEELSLKPILREMDTLLSVGEQVSASKLAILLDYLGYTAISLAGWQAGIHTNEEYQGAKIKDIEFDIDKMVVLKNSKEVSLTSLELKILNLLFTNLNKVVKREDIIEKVWEWTGNDINDNTVTVYLKRIREKLDSDIIKTIKGIGYRVDGE